MLCAYEFRAESPIPSDLDITPTIHDFGDVAQKTKLVTDFKLSNRQHRPINIVDVFKDCDCNEVALDKFRLAPGESTKIKVTWDTRQRRGVAATKVYLYYENGSGLGPFSALLTVKANVIPDFDCKPSELIFDANIPSEKTVVFSSSRLRDFRLSHAYCSHPAFRARMLNRSEIVVTFDPTLWRNDGGESAAYLTVMTSSLREPEHSIKLRLIQPGDESNRSSVTTK